LQIEKKIHYKYFDSKSEAADHVSLNQISDHNARRKVLGVRLNE